eukprot:12260197-Prorocentrum_lima.AAC.1
MGGLASLCCGPLSGSTLRSSWLELEGACCACLWAHCFVGGRCLRQGLLCAQVVVRCAEARRSQPR